MKDADSIKELGELRAQKTEMMEDLTALYSDAMEAAALLHDSLDILADALDKLHDKFVLVQLSAPETDGKNVVQFPGEKT